MCIFKGMKFVHLTGKSLTNGFAELMRFDSPKREENANQFKCYIKLNIIVYLLLYICHVVNVTIVSTTTFFNTVYICKYDINYIFSNLFVKHKYNKSAYALSINCPIFEVLLRLIFLSYFL